MCNISFKKSALENIPLLRYKNKTFIENTVMSFSEKIVALVSLKQSSNEMNSVRVFIYTMSPTCAQNMSSSGIY